MAKINGFEFIRVSTGSQDLVTQRTELDAYAGTNEINVVDRIELHGYSASAGDQEPALALAIEGIRQGRWQAILVTDSSRLERRDDATRFIRMLLSIYDAGGTIISLDEDETGFGQRESFDGWMDALDRAKYNAEKSKTVKKMTYRGVKRIIANQAWHGAMPPFWHTEGEKYRRIAVCNDPDAVRKAYEAISKGASISSVARDLDSYPHSVRKMIRTRGNMTGEFVCRYTYAGETYTWVHQSRTGAIITPELWHEANRMMDARSALGMNNLRSGRPVSLTASWVSSLLSCPGCGGILYVSRGIRLQCHGKGKDRRSCGIGSIDLESVTSQIEKIVSSDYVDVYRYQRVSGNQGELTDLKAELEAVRHSLAATDDDLRFDALAARRLALREQIAGFEVVPDKYDMRSTGETLADLWQTGDKRQILKAIMRHIRFTVTAAGHVSISGMYPGEALIELDETTCIKVSSAGFQQRRLAQYR